ncbi:hypothetical protein GDO81_001037 [Engystomops pustulosus]|uniref:Uncharacterized protein n=1 Tax=Engystomops pustulosus TaxID=76066 RepID=A0AAV7DBA4_ENGPU|nr:hypothetical protein GDO81_001037 [Engystomops pustulosus]
MLARVQATGVPIAVPVFWAYHLPSKVKALWDRTRRNPLHTKSMYVSPWPALMSTSRTLSTPNSCGIRVYKLSTSIDARWYPSSHCIS